MNMTLQDWEDLLIFWVCSSLLLIGCIPLVFLWAHGRRLKRRSKGIFK